jgi:hypothetical protein
LLSTMDAPAVNGQFKVPIGGQVKVPTPSGVGTSLLCVPAIERAAKACLLALRRARQASSTGTLAQRERHLEHHRGRGLVTVPPDRGARRFL